jgi:1,4-alpha-glucan branching enzyme
MSTDESESGAMRMVAEGRHGSPHDVLGPHWGEGIVTLRVLRPLAETVVAVFDDRRVPLEHQTDGVWEARFPGEHVPDYRLEVAYADGIIHRMDDPYRFLPTVGDVDLHLINEGRHEQLWDVLGAHVHTYGEVTGTSFAVWAPSAQGVRIEGDFNDWDPKAHPMRQLGVSGVWEIFLPDVGPGTRYKYVVLGADGAWRERADPLAQQSECPPATSSVVTESTYQWGDEEWMQRRATSNPQDAAMSAYEVHLGSWRRGRSYAELADELVAYVSEQGFTHVEFLPVMEHPFGGSWGYQVTSYFSPTARFGRPDELRLLIDRLHQAGIGVILDWVPAHFPKDAFALARFDGTPLYEDPNPARGEHPEWGTLIFNFGRKEVRNFLVASALYWLEEFHADGLRVDAVASMLYLDYAREDGEWSPNVYGGRENLESVSFLQEANATCSRRYPGIAMIAEESTSWAGVTAPTSADGLGFHLKWNMGWMHDTLGYLQQDPVHRQYHHDKMTFAMMYAYAEKFVLPLSHDEVVHGKGSLLRKMPGDRWQQLANLRAYLAYMWAHPGKKLLFMGAELGQESEWAESRELDWWLLDHSEHRGVQQLVGDLNRVYRDAPALWAQDNRPEGFSWIDADDAASNILSFLRFDGEGNAIACVANFSGHPHESHLLGLPYGGRWHEVLNTDAHAYGGSGVGNLGAVTAEEVPHRGQSHSANVVVPPLGAVWLSHAR